MSFISNTSTDIALNVKNDSKELERIGDWIANRLRHYGLNCTQQIMADQGISSSDQSAILAMIADFDRLNSVFNNQAPSGSADIRHDCAVLLGLY